MPQKFTIYGEDLRLLRAKLGLSQKIFGRCLFMSASMVSKYEKVHYLRVGEDTFSIYNSMNNMDPNKNDHKTWQRLGEEIKNRRNFVDRIVFIHGQSS